MRSYQPIAILILACAMTVSAVYRVPFAEQTPLAQNILERRIDNVKGDRVEIRNALARALMSARIPGGIVKEASVSDETDQLSVLGPTVRDLLNAIVVAVPIYRWNVDNGVVNLVPASETSVLLSCQIKRFSVANAGSTEEVIGKLLACPEVKARAAELNLNTGLRIVTSGGPDNLQKGVKTFDIELTDITLFEALNSIVRKQGHGVWEYRETHWKEHNGFEINMLVP